jgi:uncharacterized membrane protein/Arc/MetJ-type ribon-helix-helix transcriptional regulator
MAGVPAPRPSQFERMVFFSDAVFAISITLLAIDLRLPETAARLTGGDLNRALVDLAPKVFTYAMSFAVIGLYWLAHWRRFDVIRSADERLVTINLVLLGFIGLIPFPTSLLGDHGDQPSVVILYALVMSGAGIAGTSSWLYANRAGLAPHGRSERWVRAVALRGLIIPAVFPRQSPASPCEHGPGQPRLAARLPGAGLGPAADADGGRSRGGLGAPPAHPWHDAGMKLRVSLPEADVRFLDQCAQVQGYRSRSAVLHKAVRLLHAYELCAAYEGAWDEWNSSSDAEPWTWTAANGLGPDITG